MFVYVHMIRYGPTLVGQVGLVHVAWSGFTLFAYVHMIRYGPTLVDLTHNFDQYTNMKTYNYS